jgi:hypothetical protein
MTRTEEATWLRLELQCVRTLMSINLSGAESHQMEINSSARATLQCAGCSTTRFGGTVSAPANAIAVDAIGNAFAKGAAFDGFPTTAEVNPVYSSADYLQY